VKGCESALKSTWGTDSGWAKALGSRPRSAMQWTCLRSSRRWRAQQAGLPGRVRLPAKVACSAAGGCRTGGTSSVLESGSSRMPPSDIDPRPWLTAPGTATLALASVPQCHSTGVGWPRPVPVKPAGRGQRSCNGKEHGEYHNVVVWACRPSSRTWPNSSIDAACAAPFNPRRVTRRKGRTIYGRSTAAHPGLMRPAYTL
jgi:hypothetical protein